MNLTNSIRFPFTFPFLASVLLSFASSPASAQTNSWQLITERPRNGAFYSLQLPNLPPLPMNPLPEQPLWRVSEGIYVIQDLDVDYSTLDTRTSGQSRVQTEEPPPSPGDGGPGGGYDAPPPYSFGPDDLFLIIAGVTNGTANLYLHPPAAESATGVFDLFMTTNLSISVQGLNATNWLWVARSAPGQTNLTLPNLTPEAAYFLLARTNDDDGDGMSTAFERLSSHTLENNADQNTNGIPDGWEWDNFGSLQPANGDYDHDYQSNLTEYQAGTDPNTIEFSFAPSSRKVNNRSAPMLITVLRGVPASVAVLVDSTNFAAASWGSFSPSPTADLGATEGWHRIWLGLRGRMLTSQATWRTATVKLDSTPPPLVITNPISLLVDQPLIQLQGYSPEALASLTYDLTSAEGTLTNQQVLILAQEYDARNWEVTTNYFQCFDVKLTSGSNTITLRATDMAGNVTATNLTLTLDCSARTNPPTLTLYWPQDGTRVGTTTFTCRGHVDDPSATVLANFVDATGLTNTLAAAVNRNGDFWINDLPLPQATNLLTLTATNLTAASSTTNAEVIKSDVTLTVSPPAYWSPWPPPIGGTVSDPASTVWVNGTRATNAGGSWTADACRLDLDNPLIQVRAIPNSDHGGCGTPAAPLHNPDSPNSTDTEMEVQWPDAVIYAHLDIYADEAATWSASPWALWKWGECGNWQEPTGGTGLSYSTNDPPAPDPAFEYCDVNTWLPGRWPLLYDGYWTSLLNGATNYTSPWNMALAHPTTATHADLDFDGLAVTPTASWHYSWHWHEDEQLNMITGGPASSTESEVYTISGYAWWNVFPTDPWSDFGSSSNVPPEQIRIGNLGNLDTNGSLLVVLPAHTVVDVTPYLATPGPNGSPAAAPAPPSGSRTYGAVIQATRDPWISECIATTPADRHRTNLGVGERVTLFFFPRTTQHPRYTWKGGGSMIQTPEDGVFVYTAPSNQATVTITANFTNGSVSRTFNIIEPTNVHHAVTVERQYYNLGEAGAGMHIRPYVGPTNVSFYRVQLFEVGQAATNKTGYFIANPPPPHDFDHRAEHWFPLDYSNAWPANYDWATSEVLPPPWSPGRFTWHIPAKWKVGAGPTNDLAGSWDQLFTLASDGTVTVTKFDHIVTRQTTEHYGTIFPDP